MKWLKWILIGVAALLLLFAAVSLALPSRFGVERSVAIASSAGKVYPLIAYRLPSPEFGMQPTGLLPIEPNGNGARVSWSNEGDMGANPVNRWSGLFMDRRVGPDFEAGLSNLVQLAETS
jgi:hypothetical protein